MPVATRKKGTMDDTPQYNGSTTTSRFSDPKDNQDHPDYGFGQREAEKRESAAHECTPDFSAANESPEYGAAEGLFGPIPAGPASQAATKETKSFGRRQSEGGTRQAAAEQNFRGASPRAASLFSPPPGMGLESPADRLSCEGEARTQAPQAPAASGTGGGKSGAVRQPSPVRSETASKIQELSDEMNVVQSQTDQLQRTMVLRAQIPSAPKIQQAKPPEPKREAAAAEIVALAKQQ